MSLKDIRRSKGTVTPGGDKAADGQLGHKGDYAAMLRERRRECGIVQISAFVREEDKAGAIRALRDYTDRAWLKMYDSGMVLSGANEARANDIRKRLASNAEMDIDVSQIDTGF